MQQNFKKNSINVKISGFPYVRNRPAHGNVNGPRDWTEAVIKQTKGLRKVKGPCSLNVTFLLRENQFPTDCPYGPDLDNLLKRFFDALNQTVFKNVPGHDSCVISVNARKKQVKNEKDAGALLKIKWGDKK